VADMEVPPSELAEMKLTQARAAATAGARAWQQPPVPGNSGLTCCLPPIAAAAHGYRVPPAPGRVR
jgi:hypothetical protein